VIKSNGTKSAHMNIIWQQLIKYKTKTGTFDLQLAWKTVDKIDSIAWWKGNFEASAPELCKVAVRILSIPSSSAASERNWSTSSYIEKKRN
jgi:hAT family C-terminal dimerisation region